MFDSNGGFLGHKNHHPLLGLDIEVIFLLVVNSKIRLSMAYGGLMMVLIPFGNW